MIFLNRNFSKKHLTRQSPSNLRVLPVNNQRNGEGGLRVKGLCKKTLPNQPLISIITVTYNAVPHLQNCLRSVLNQPYDNIEYLVIDGNSTDGTVDVIKQYEGYIDYWVSEPDNGIYDAMNKGITLARGNWVYFLGADDILVNCIKQVARVMRQPRTIYYGDVYLPRKNKTYAGSFDWYKLTLKNINHQAIFYPRCVFDYYRYDLRYPVWADYDLNMRLWHNRRFRFRYMPQLICIHGDAGFSQGRIDEAFMHNKSLLVQRYFGRKLVIRRTYLSLYRRVRNLVYKVGL